MIERKGMYEYKYDGKSVWVPSMPHYCNTVGTVRR